MSVMTFLLDVLTEILSWLPTKHLLRFKCVSKSWYNLINDPSFIRLHCSRSKTSLIILEFPFEDCPDARSSPFYNLSYEPVKGVQLTRYMYDHKALNNIDEISILGSCNGLLCLQGTFCSHNLYSLYNPATRAYKCITPISCIDSSTTSKYQPVALLSSNDRRFIAFGYDRVSDDYKILMLTKYSASNELVTNFYSLKTDTWAIIQNPPWNWVVLCRSSAAVCVNSSLHWLAWDEPEEIKCFDLCTRRYYRKPVPETIASHSPMLGVVRGRLCVVTRVLDIWVLDKDGVNKSWTRVFHNLSRIYAVINTWGSNLSCACIEHGSNNILVVISNAAKNALCSYMFCCDQRSGKTRVIATPCSIDGVALHSPVQPWVESLVPLETKQQVRKQKRGQVDEEDIRNDARQDVL